MSSVQFSKNNFDLIRLFAATQVAVCHSIDIMSHEHVHAAVIRVLELFPGVPIFFFISGFLISKAYERNPELKVYAKNRALRIFPGLHVCLIVNLLLIAATGYFALVGAGFFDILVLYLAKGSILQFYNPDFMRQFGDGVLNGSLWTVCVELQFYFLIPLLYLTLLGKSRARNAVVLLVLIGLSFATNRLLYALQLDYAETVHWKLLRVSFLPWLCMFLAGVLAQQNFDRLQAILTSRFLIVGLAVYIPLAYFLQLSGVRFDNGMNPLIGVPVFALVMAAAYVKPHVADSLLHKNDISYGVYIYHMVVVNMFLYYGYQGQLVMPLAACAISILLAYASWMLVEKPSLRRKEKSLHSLKVPT